VRLRDDAGGNTCHSRFDYPTVRWVEGLEAHRAVVDEGCLESACLARRAIAVRTESSPATAGSAERLRNHQIDLDAVGGPVDPRLSGVRDEAAIG
jgi:hypothetical protein